jgi:hypothetical protein
VGWTPTKDVDQTRQPVSAGSSLCDQIMSKAGLTPASAADRWTMYTVCSGLFFLQQSLDSAQPVTRAGFRTAVEQLGHPTASAAVGYTERYGPGKHWGTGACRLSAYQESCSCFTYTSTTMPID